MWGLVFTEQEPPFDSIDCYTLLAGEKKKSVLHIAKIQKHRDGRSTQIFYSSESTSTTVQKQQVSSTISLNKCCLVA